MKINEEHTLAEKENVFMWRIHGCELWTNMGIHILNFLYLYLAPCLVKVVL